MKRSGIRTSASISFSVLPEPLSGQRVILAPVIPLRSATVSPSNFSGVHPDV
jgi:hypothetical protein